MANYEDIYVKAIVVKNNGELMPAPWNRNTIRIVTEALVVDLATPQEQWRKVDIWTNNDSDSKLMDREYMRQLAVGEEFDLKIRQRPGQDDTFYPVLPQVVKDHWAQHKSIPPYNRVMAAGAPAPSNGSVAPPPPAPQANGYQPAAPVSQATRQPEPGPGAYRKSYEQLDDFHLAVAEVQITERAAVFALALMHAEPLARTLADMAWGTKAVKPEVFAEVLRNIATHLSMEVQPFRLRQENLILEEDRDRFAKMQEDLIVLPLRKQVQELIEQTGTEEEKILQYFGREAFVDLTIDELKKTAARLHEKLNEQVF